MGKPNRSQTETESSRMETMKAYGPSSSTHQTETSFDLEVLVI